jgi:hypothetical protein
LTQAALPGCPAACQGKKLLTIAPPTLDKGSISCYIVTMKTTKARVNPKGFMGSASREHRVKKGKGSFTRKPKHKKPIL